MGRVEKKVLEKVDDGRDGSPQGILRGKKRKLQILQRVDAEIVRALALGEQIKEKG